MNKKIISEILSSSLTITPLSEIIYNISNNNIVEAKERGKFSFLRGLFKILVRNVDAITYSKVRNYIRLHGNKNEKRLYL